MIPEIVKKYINKYSLPGWTLEHSGVGNINNAVVIPAISEYENIKVLLSSLSENKGKYFDSTLIIFVVNNLASSNDEIKIDNQKTIELLRSIKKKESKDGLINKIVLSGLRIAIVDAASECKELPEKDGGVGLARKIGMDLALTIFNYNSANKKVLICLDADCTVEKNYLTEVIDSFNQNNLSAAVINFSHSLDCPEEMKEAIICYEIFIRYYVLGLRLAGSPYAFHAIGSTMACDYKSYIKAEGMNKRKAAEDFYFLEKLAKNVKVERINSTAVHPSPRQSWRVPFGTGQRVNRFLSKAQNEYLLYNPASFYILKEWLELFLGSEIKSSAEILISACNISSDLNNFLISQKFENGWNKIIKNSSSPVQIQKQKNIWFDSFRTMKLIHYLRDTNFPMINMFDAVDEMFIKTDINLPERKNVAIPPLEIQKEYLEILRKNT